MLKLSVYASYRANNSTCVSGDTLLSFFLKKKRVMEGSVIGYFPLPVFLYMVFYAVRHMRWRRLQQQRLQQLQKIEEEEKGLRLYFD